MEVRRCVRQSRDAAEARLAPTRRSEHDEQGQEHQEEHGEEAGPEDAEGEAPGQEGEEVGGGSLPFYAAVASASSSRRSCSTLFSMSARSSRTRSSGRFLGSSKTQLIRRTPGVTGQTSSLQVETATSAQSSASWSSFRGT